MSDAPPSWSTWRDIPRVVLDARNLRQSAAAAVIVGTVLFAVNQLDVVMAGDATTAVWVKSAVTYLVPFTVTNYGIVVGSRAHR